MLFHQDNASSHKSTVAMTKLRIRLWIDSSSILFSGFGPVWLLSVPKLKNLARWEKILVKWGSHCRRQRVFCRLWDSLLQIYFQNPKRKKSWIDPAQSTSSSRPNRFRRKMLCVWWDQEGVVYYELLKPGETVNVHGYHQ